MNGLTDELKKVCGGKRIFVVFLILALILELSIFNLRTWRAVFYSIGNEQSKILDYASVNDSASKVRIYNIGKEIKNIYIDLQPASQIHTPPDEKAKVVLHMTDKGNSEMLAMPVRYIITGVEATKYIPLQLTGQTEDMEIEFKDLNNKEYLINGVYINKIPPFSFSVLRLLFVFAVFSLLYIIRFKSGFYMKELNLSSVNQLGCVMIIVTLLCILFISLCFSNYQWAKGTISHQQQYNELAEAFLDGHFYLNEEPAQGLKNMENPYDTNGRKKVLDQRKEFYRWDHAYFGGKYYVYFGVTPELILYYPAKALFGYDLRNNEAAALLGVWFIPAAFWLVYLIIKRMKIQVPFLVYCMLSTLFVWGSGIMRAGGYADMYHVPIVAGLTLTVLGLALMFDAAQCDEKWSDKPVTSGFKLFFGALCLALVSGCRPQMMLGSFLLIPLFWDTVFKKRLMFSRKSVFQTVMFILPYVAVAAFMMYYNYVRFGSPFDFGANYNLTTNDMTSRGFKLARIPLGIFTYMFQPPSVHSEFPFFHSPYVFTAYQGVTIMESMAGGIFVTNCFLLFTIFLPKVKNQLKQSKMSVFALLSLVFGVVICIADTEMAGLLERYTMDFAWLIYISAIAVFAALIEKYRDTDFSALLYRLFSISFVFTLVFCVLNIFLYSQFGFSESTPRVFYSIYYALCFWM